MSTRSRMQKMAQDAVLKATEAVAQANRALSEAQAALAIMEELSADELRAVNGAGDPFQDSPRVPDAPIDMELRGKG